MMVGENNWIQYAAVCIPGHQVMLPDNIKVLKHDEFSLTGIKNRYDAIYTLWCHRQS